jgi:acetyl-CoA carboxylase biotin carboxyl carrier protein
VAARKKAARPGDKTSGKGKTRAKAARPATGGRAGGSTGQKVSKPGKATKKAMKKATKKAVSRSGGRPARPGHPPVKVVKPARKTTRRKATRKKATTSKAGTASASAFPEISDLAGLMEQHGLVEVEYERSSDGTTRIHVKRAGAGGGTVVAPMAAPAPVVAAETLASPAAAPSEPAPVVADDLHAFKSPMVGTFYRAPSPEASSFANVGDSIDPSSTVCIIEAMKVMNEITPDVAGEVVSIEVENGEAVEYGQTLMLIRTR